MCPFIKVDVVDAILAKVSRQVDVSTITRFEKVDIIRGVSDIQALEKLMDRGEVRRNSKVHAKLLISDEKIALISSANLSSTGLYHNFECGVLTDEPSVIAEALSFFEEVWNDLYTIVVTKNDLNNMQKYAFNEYQLIDMFENLIPEAGRKGIKVSSIDKLLQTYVKSIESERQNETVLEVVSNWIKKDIQPAKIIKLLVIRDNNWLSPKEVSISYPEIKDPGTVMYDLAKRGSKKYYLRRPRYYPRSSSILPIFEYNKRKGYRIKTKIFNSINNAVRDAYNI